MHYQRNEAREDLLKKTDDELREMIMQALASDDIDIEYVNCISDILAERHPEQYHFDDEGILESVFQISEEDEKLHRKHHRRGLRKMVAVAAILAVVIISMLTVPVHGANLWQLIVGWTSELFSMNASELDKVAEDNLTVNASKDSFVLYNYLVEHGVTAEVAPKFFPEEYVLETLQQKEYGEGKVKYIAEYAGEEIHSISVHIRNFKDPVSVAESDSANDYEPYLCNGIEHFIFTNLDSVTVTWNSEGYSGLIVICSETITMSEVYQIIGSIYK